MASQPLPGSIGSGGTTDLWSRSGPVSQGDLLNECVRNRRSRGGQRRAARSASHYLTVLTKQTTPSSESEQSIQTPELSCLSNVVWLSSMNIEGMSRNGVCVTQTAAAKRDTPSGRSTTGTLQLGVTHEFSVFRFRGDAPNEVDDFDHRTDGRGRQHQQRFCWSVRSPQAILCRPM